MTPYMSPIVLFEGYVDTSDALATPRVQALRTQFTQWEAEGRNPVMLKTGYRIALEDFARLLDEMESPSNWALHHQIYQDKRLLYFLEYGHPALLEERPDFWEKSPEDLRHFIKPFFALQIRENWQEAEQKQDTEAMELLFPFLHLVPDLQQKSKPKQTDSDTSHWAEASAQLADDNPLVQGIYRIRNLSNQEDLYYLSERELLSYFSDHDIRLYNQMQKAQPARDQLGKEVLHLVMILLEEHGRRDGADAMLRQLAKLRLNEAMRKHIEEFKRNYAIGRNLMPLWLKIGIAVILLLFLFKYLETQFFSVS